MCVYENRLPANYKPNLTSNNTKTMFPESPNYAERGSLGAPYAEADAGQDEEADDEGPEDPQAT